MCFVREILRWQQARTGRSLLEPSAHNLTNLHHNSHKPWMARIIVRGVTMTKHDEILVLAPPRKGMARPTNRLGPQASRLSRDAVTNPMGRCLESLSSRLI